MTEFETPGPGEDEPEFHLWLAERHLRSAQNLLDKPARVGTPGAVAVEFTKDEAEAMMSVLSRTRWIGESDGFSRGYRKLYNALAIESGGGQNLDPAIVLPKEAA